MAEQQTLEHRILVALTAKKLEEAIRSLGREYGEHLKAQSVDVKDFQLLLLDLTGEAYEFLKQKAQQQAEKKS